MATYTILVDNAPYYTIRAAFDDHTFDQTIVSSLVGAELAAFIQDYVDEYETAWLALLVEGAP